MREAESLAPSASAMAETSVLSCLTSDTKLAQGPASDPGGWRAASWLAATVSTPDAFWSICWAAASDVELLIVPTGASAALPALQMASALAMKADAELPDEEVVVLDGAEEDEARDDEPPLAEEDDGDDEPPQAPKARGATTARSART